MPWGEATGRRWLACAGLGAVMFVALLALHHTPRPALARTVAVSDALRAARQSAQWPDVRWNRVTVGAVDHDLTRVAFWRGPQISGEVALRRDGTADQVQLYPAGSKPFGSPIAYEPALLVLLGAIFVLACGVRPLARRRNLDVLAALSLIVPVELLAQRYVAASVLAAVPGLLWLGGRGLQLAIHGAEATGPQVPLLDALTPAWAPAQRVRLLRLVALALGLIYVMVAVSSTGPVDVIYGAMEGATKLIGGLLPYGHLPGDVIHGDTYPIGTYALYVPVALLAPVRSVWDSVDLALGAGAALALGTAWLSGRVARSAIEEEGAEPAAAGARTALAWLAFPPLLIAVSSGTTDVLLAALLVGALCAVRRPGLSTGLITLAGWVKLAPFALLPMWVASCRRANRRRSLLAAAAVSSAAVLLMVAVGGWAGPVAMLHAVAFQFTRGSPQSIWSVLGAPGLQLLGQAALLAGVLASAMFAHRTPELARDPRRMAGMTVALLVGLELVTNYWSVLYLVWIAGLLPLSVLAPVPAAAGRTVTALEAIRSRPVAAAV